MNTSYIDNILEEIVEYKRGQLERRKEVMNVAALEKQAEAVSLPRNFLKALSVKPYSVIAEVKTIE